jgi:hypothetical protein
LFSPIGAHRACCRWQAVTMITVSM